MREPVIERIRTFLRDHAQRHSAAIFATISPSGLPHATWMGTVASPRLDRVLTMTSPDSRKVINLLLHPHVEWLLTDEPKERVLYLRGHARVLEDPAEVEAAWARLGDKSRAWFLKRQEKIGIQFLIIETSVEEVEYQEPRQNLAEVVRIGELSGALDLEPLPATDLRVPPG